MMLLIKHQTLTPIIKIILIATSLGVRFIKGFTVPSTLTTHKYQPLSTFRLYETVEKTNANVDKSFFFANSKKSNNSTSKSNTKNNATSNIQTTTTLSRTLGSQELLMLPRQYGPHLATRQNNDNNSSNNKPFPPMSHVSTILLSSTPSLSTLKQSIDQVMITHPLLRCYIQGDGEPTKRIDLFQMVREGDPNPCTFVAPSPLDTFVFTSKDVLTVVDIPTSGKDMDKDKDILRQELNTSWKQSFAFNLDGPSNWNTLNDVTSKPLWRVELHHFATTTTTTTTTTANNQNYPCALVFTFNHAISDQSSVNMLMEQIVSNLASIDDGNTPNKALEQGIPMSLEDSVLGKDRRFQNVQLKDVSTNTASYVLSKAAEGSKNPVILPDVNNNDTTSSSSSDGSGLFGALTIISGNSPGGKSTNFQERRSTLQFRTLSDTSTNALVAKCRENGVSMSHALCAAMTFTSSDYIDNGVVKVDENDQTKLKQRNYKVLHSLDMRRFGAQLDKCQSVSCMAGSHDLLLGPISDRSGQSLRRQNNDDDDPKSVSPSLSSDIFWEMAKECKKQTDSFISSRGPEEAVRVWDFAMTISDMNNLVHLSAQSKESQGRGYSAGIANAGVFERQKSVIREGDDDNERQNLKTQHGRYNIEEVYYATSHARSGCLYQASCLTLNGRLQCTFHPAMPIVSEETNKKFADSFVDLLEVMSGVKAPTLGSDADVESQLSPSSPLSILPKNSLTLAAAAYGVLGLILHANGWSNFISSVLEMKANVDNPADFWAALNFWIFFAVGHPILQPILWISDVLHGTPGPKVFGDLVPLLFVMGNVFFIWLVSASKEVRNAVNVLALSAFLTYVGAGLDGQAGVGDYNLALDDNYKGRIVKGCPSYEEVRQSSMDDFDINKYQGLWYEQKFHDWTQFKEVYDTTLDIKLTSDGKGWIDDFAVKGPAEASAPLSWDKSPVANGAHYFLFGRVDEKDPPGILRESGFGVEFPNYIVDVQKDPTTGEYTEAIQFQCLERGGVRVFEGINFMSRKPVMSAEEMKGMHARAAKAGMDPYGSSPEQMHTVARRDVNAPEIDNNWQAMWRSLGVDKLLELLAESIEDGGR